MDQSAIYVRDQKLAAYRHAFAHEGRVCHQRFAESLQDELFSVFVLTDASHQPAGYCAYWTDIVSSGRCEDLPVLFYQIHYVYLRPEYRGQGLGTYMAEKLAGRVMQKLVLRPGVCAFCDKSLYVSNEGAVFGRKVRTILNQTKRLPFV